MELQPATHAQYVKAGDDWIVVEDDVGNVVRDLKAIDSRLCVRFNPFQGFYALFMRESIKGYDREYLVRTVTELDQRLVERIRYIVSSQYDYVKEIEEGDKQAEKEIDQKFHEIHAENAEKLAHAIRKDLGIKDKVFFESR